MARINRSAASGRFVSPEDAAADPERHVTETVRALGKPTHWAVTPGGMSIYLGGELVAIIPAAQFGELVYQIASVMREPGA